MKNKIQLVIALMIAIIIYSGKTQAQSLTNLDIYNKGKEEQASLNYENALYCYYLVYENKNSYVDYLGIPISYKIGECLNLLGAYNKSNEFLLKLEGQKTPVKKEISAIKKDNDKKLTSDTGKDWLNATKIQNYKIHIEASVLISDGNTNYNSKKYTDAISNYEKAYTLIKDNLETGDAEFLSNYGLAIVLAGLVDYQKSLDLLNKCHQLKPDIAPMTYLVIGIDHFYLKNYDEALKWYNYTIDETKFTINDDFKKIVVEEIEKTKTQIEHKKQADILKLKPVNVIITNLGKEVNSKYGDYFPSITADESQILFTSTREGTTGGTVFEDGYTEDFWYCYADSTSKWLSPVNLGPPVNTNQNEGGAAFTGDGQYVVCTKCGESDSYGTCDIYGAKLKGNNWEKPVNLGSAINSPSWDSQATITADGYTMVWASSRPGGIGLTDLWMSRKSLNDIWGNAVNLGNVINTTGNETSPFLQPDGKALYFVSDSHTPNMGSYDIFKSVLNDDSTWSKPENMGYPINSEYDDIYFVLAPSGIVGYFASDRPGGLGKLDLYKIDFPGVTKASLTTLVGYVYDQETKKPIEAQIYVEDLESQKPLGKFISNSESGKFVIVLNAGKNYSLSVNKETYLFHSENFNIPTGSEFKEVEKKIYLQKIKSGSKIVLNNLFFDSGLSSLRKESELEIDRIYKLMTVNPEIKVEISGHTDDVGEEADNIKLSQARAKVVVDALIKMGIPSARMSSKGYGESLPLGDNKTEEGRQVNRRTEFKVL